MSDESQEPVESDDDVANAEFGPVTPGAEPTRDPGQLRANLRMIYDIPVEVSAELGQRTVNIKDLLSFGPGAVIELERMAGKSVDLLVNGVLIGKGDVVVVNENYGLRITEIIAVEDRLNTLAEA